MNRVSLDRCPKCGEEFFEGQTECFMCVDLPLEDDFPRMVPGVCFKCGREEPWWTITMHEPLMGAKYRQLSIKFKLQVPLCMDCHELVQREGSQEYNKYLQVLMQRKYERESHERTFLEEFGRNYL